jgi:hypothetical protein
MNANLNPYDVDAEVEFTPDPPIRLSGPPAYANSLAQKSPAPESTEYTGPPLEFSPTPPMAHPTPLETRKLTPTEKERADAIHTSGLHDDPMIAYSLLRHLRNYRLITVDQLYARELYPPDLYGDQPLTEAVLVNAFGGVVDRCDELKRELIEAKKAQKFAEDRLANTELLVDFLRGGGTAPDASGVKRRREGYPE